MPIVNSKLIENSKKIDNNVDVCPNIIGPFALVNEGNLLFEKQQKVYE